MAAYGIPEDDISRVISVDPKTLRKNGDGGGYPIGNRCKDVSEACAPTDKETIPERRKDLLVLFHASEGLFDGRR